MPGRCPLFLSPNLITKSCYFSSSIHTIFSIPTVLSYSYPHHLKPELFSHLLTGFLTLPSAFPEHSLHCTSLIKSFSLHLVLWRWIWAPHDWYPLYLSSHMLFLPHPTMAQPHWVTCSSGGTVPLLPPTFAFAALPIWEALAHLAHCAPNQSSRPRLSITSLGSLSSCFASEGTLGHVSILQLQHLLYCIVLSIVFSFPGSPSLAKSIWGQRLCLTHLGYPSLSTGAGPKQSISSESLKLSVYSHTRLFQCPVALGEGSLWQLLWSQRSKEPLLDFCYWFFPT